MTFVLFLGSGTFGQDDTSPTVDFTEWSARRLKEMRDYEVTVNTAAGPRTPELEDQPLLTWSNPIRTVKGTPHRGNLFVWTIDGIPQLVCCAFPFPEPTITTHEFQSLSDVAMTIESSERESVPLESPQPTLKPLPEAPFPAGSRSLRLSQMRKLARRFSAHIAHAEIGEDKTRLLTQPIYRYPPEAATDGAIFALSQGTDPECLVLLQSTEDGWQYRIARMTAISLTVRLDEEVIRDAAAVWIEKDPSYHSLRVQD